MLTHRLTRRLRPLQKKEPGQGFLSAVRDNNSVSCPKLQDKNVAERRGVISVLLLQGRSYPNLIICKSVFLLSENCKLLIIGVRGTVGAHGWVIQ